MYNPQAFSKQASARAFDYQNPATGIRVHFTNCQLKSRRQAPAL